MRSSETIGVAGTVVFAGTVIAAVVMIAKNGGRYGDPKNPTDHR